MVTQRTLLHVPVVLAGVALLAGCGPPPRGIQHETISMFAESVVDFSTNGSPANSTDYSEIQALGQPNVVGCGDDPNAWSPAIANPDAPGLFTIDDFIVLEFPFYAYVREVRIFESYNPGAVVAVDLERSDEGLPPLEIFADIYGDGLGPCPSSFNIQVESNGGVTADQYNRVAIYLDNSRIGDGNGNVDFSDDWPEIDAVEVIGDILVDD